MRTHWETVNFTHLFDFLQQNSQNISSKLGPLLWLLFDKKREVV